MEQSNRTQLVVAMVLSFAFVVTASAQLEKKSYEQWSEKEATQLLNDSPWCQTQAVTDTSKMFDTNRRLDSGQTRVADVTTVNFRIRFFSAKPVRQAMSRSIELKQKGQVSEQMAAQLKALATADITDYIMVTVTVDAPNPSQALTDATSVLLKLNTAVLKNNTYLLVKGGQRLFISEYQPPRRDGFGARFVFPRVVDGNPFITPESGEVQFFSDLNNEFRMENKPVTLSTRFKAKDMMFDGKLEY
ncbi:MAG TPA: hypothetical protein VJH03_11530 [Blastocatellia bacterium]|nr:hypothetical protein [Blastocatellia bacterium]